MTLTATELAKTIFLLIYFKRNIFFLNISNDHSIDCSVKEYGIFPCMETAIRPVLLSCYFKRI